MEHTHTKPRLLTDRAEDITLDLTGRQPVAALFLSGGKIGFTIWDASSNELIIESRAIFSSHTDALGWLGRFGLAPCGAPQSMRQTGPVRPPVSSLPDRDRDLVSQIFGLWTDGKNVLAHLRYGERPLIERLRIDLCLTHAQAEWGQPA